MFQTPQHFLWHFRPCILYLTQSMNKLSHIKLSLDIITEKEIATQYLYLLFKGKQD